MLQGNKRNIGVLAGILAALFIFMAGTNPKDLPAVLLVLPLVGLFILGVYSALTLFRLLQAFQGSDNRLRRLGYAVVIATLPAGVLLLNSIDQLTVKDLALIALLTGLSLFYVGRLRFSRKLE